MGRSAIPSLVVAAALAAAGCRLPVSTPAKPKPATAVAASAAPVFQATEQLAGKVKLIAGAGGALGKGAGAGLIGNNSGGIISDHASGIISNHGGNIISDHASGYRVRAAEGLQTYALADADVTFTNAAGEPLRGADGQPIVARTDGQGAYALHAALPKGNVVARVKLWNGGELAGLVVPDAKGTATLDLDLASTLGAGYVLARYVKGDQAVLDRLARTEADRLRQELDVVRKDLVAAPSYLAADLLAATEALRTKEAPVNKAIEDVRALLLGQANLGAGLPATQVPLALPTGLAWDPAGGLLIGELEIGRVRRLTAAGTLETLADAGSGKIPNNFLRLTDVARAADGTLYASTASTGLYRADPSGHVERILATTEAALGRDLLPNSLAVAPDGTLYVGEFTYPGSGTAPRVLAVAPNGKATKLAVDAWKGGSVAALAVAPDGALYVAYAGDPDLTVYKVVDGKGTKVATLAGGPVGDMALAPGGSLYFSRPDAHRVDVLAPGGSPKDMGIQGLGEPRSLAVGPDGTLYVADLATSRVGALSPGGAWSIVAGADAQVETGDTTAFAINQPVGVAFDQAGALYIAESGNARIRRYLDGKLEPFAGAGPGDEGDGGPALAAKLGFPMSLVAQGGELWVAENTGTRIRHIGSDGTVGSLGLGSAAPSFKVGKVYPPGTGLPSLYGLARDGQGRFYLTGNGQQVLRLDPDGSVRAVAGRHRPDGPDVFSPLTYFSEDETRQDTAVGFALGVAVGPDGLPYFAEAVTCRITKVVDPDGPAPRLQRVAGIKLADMAAEAGAGTVGLEDHVAADHAALLFPTGVAFDAAGNMYVTEAGTIHVGALATIANAGASGQGLGTGITDKLGFPHVAGRVRKVAPDGTITTVAGRGSRFFPDDSGPNALILPMGVAIAPDGRLAISDTGANTVRILPAGSY